MQPFRGIKGLRALANLYTLESAVCNPKFGKNLENENKIYDIKKIIFVPVCLQMCLQEICLSTIISKWFDQLGQVLYLSLYRSDKRVG